MPPQQSAETKPPDLNRMIDLLEKLFRPDPAAPPQHGGCGLIGMVTIVDESQLPAFRAELAELMVKYNVDKLDVAWQVPLVVKKYSLRRDPDPELAQV